MSRSSKRHGRTREPAIDLNLSTLKKKLCSIYKTYLQEGPSSSLTKDALQLASLWTASPVLPPPLRDAVNALPGLFSLPPLSRKRAKDLLELLTSKP